MADILQQEVDYGIDEAKRKKTLEEQQIEAARNIFSADVMTSRKTINDITLKNYGDITYQGAKNANAQKVFNMYGGLQGSGALTYNQQVANNKTQSGLYENALAGNANLTELATKEQRGLQGYQDQYNNTQNEFNNTVNDINFNANIQRQRDAEAQRIAEENKRISDQNALVVQQEKDRVAQIKTNSKNVLNEMQLKTKNQNPLDTSLSEDKYIKNVANYIRTNNLSDEQKQDIIAQTGYSPEYLSYITKEVSLDHQEEVTKGYKGDLAADFKRIDYNYNTKYITADDNKYLKQTYIKNAYSSGKISKETANSLFAQYNL